MDFPHTITVFEKQNKDGTYPRKEIEGVYWYGTEGFTIAGKGIVPSNSINIIIPKEKLPEDFNIRKGCRIVKGLASDIKKTINELNDYDEVMTVTSTNLYDVGSSLDCLLIGGE